MIHALLRNDYAGAIARAQALVARASHRDLCDYVRAQPDLALRERMVCLLRDVLSVIPGRRWGFPLLLHLTDHGCDVVELPTTLEPPAQCKAYSWLPLLVDAPAADIPVCVATNQLHVTVLAVTTETPVTELEIAEAWWNQLFAGVADRTVLSVRGALAWPDALEAAAAMLHGANTRPIPYASSLFLGPAALESAHAAGRDFAARYSRGSA